MKNIRISKENLIELTGKQQTGAQVKWFKEKLLIDIVCDSKGPIINYEIYNDLLKRRYGLLTLVPTSVAKRPQVALRQL